MTDTLTAEPSPPIISPALRSLRTNGTHSVGIKVLAWGEAGSGKSYLMAHFPSPKVVLTAGDHGIKFMLPEEDHPYVFDVSHPDHVQKAVDLAVDNPGFFKSLIIDPLTLVWEDWMDAFNDEFGGDIRGGQWKSVKAPWKILMRKMMRSPLHVGLTGWVNDIVYEQQEISPGVKGKLEIFAQEKPKVEKQVPHIFHLGLQCVLGRDKLRRPTKTHIYRVSKARRPKTVDPKELHVGKEWKFDELKPVDPWEAIIAPLLPHWQVNGETHDVGMDPLARQADLADINKIAQDATVGEILGLIHQEYASLDLYRQTFEAKIAMPLAELDPSHVALVVDAHNKRKGELK